LKKLYGKGYANIEKLVLTLGARGVTSTVIRKDIQLSDDTLVMAAHGDIDAITLHNNEYACYDKELLSMSILRGKLALDEFKLTPATKKGGAKKKKGLA
jgi:hypothetical protein